MIMTAAPDSRPNALDVEFYRGERNVPDTNFDVGFYRNLQHLCDGIAAESRLESEVSAPVNGATKESHAFIPGD